MIPVPGAGIGTPYGRRGPYWSCDRDAYGNGIHTGADFPAATGTRVVAARPGTAVYCNHGSAFGNHQLEIRCGDGTRDFYAHMPSRAVANGARVEAGQTVGKVGAEGNVTGPHLHFERHATETGGWSCSVVRDPAPSINYTPSAAAGGGGGGGKDDDMPEYASAKGQGTNLTGGAWVPITWAKDAGGVIAKGSPGIDIGGAKYVATLTARVTGRNGKTVRTSTVEREGNNTPETGPPVTHDRDYLTDTRTGLVQKGRVLRWRIMCDGDAVLEAAHVAVVYWK